VRHRLAVILAVAICAVLAGARSFTAIAEWAAGIGEATRAGPGITGVVPPESTIRRTLQRLDAGALDDLAGAWAQQRTAPSAGRRRVIAVDGKTLRGSASGTGPGRHLLAALDQSRGVVLGQVDAEVKTNEIPMLSVLLGKISLKGAIVTADALHAQRGHARYLVDQRGAHYILTSRATSRNCAPSSQACPGATSRSPAAPATAAMAGTSGAPSRSPAQLPGCPSRTPPRPSAAAGRCAARSGPARL
jgi:hypothetical protein